MNFVKSLDIHSVIRKHGKALFLILMLVLACTLDYLFVRGHKTSVLIMLTISICVFFVSQFDMKLSKKAVLLNLSYNIIMLLLTINTRLYIINVLLLSYILWYIITPYIVKFKKLIGIILPVLLLVSYVIPLFNLKIPLFPLVLFPVYLLGYTIKGMKISKIKYGLPILLLNFVSSLAATILFVIRTRYVLSSPNLRFINLWDVSSETALYLPFWTLILLWFSVSFGMLFMYVFKSFIKNKSEKDGFEKLFTRLSKDSFNLVGFFAFAGTLLFFAEYAIRGSISETIRMITDTSSMFNLIFLCTLLLLFVALIGRVLSSIIIGASMTILTIANYIKFKYWDEPFYPWDIYILKEGVTISKEYVNLTLVVIVLVILLIGFVALLIFNKKVRSFFKPKFNLPLVPIAIILILINVSIVNSPKELSKMAIAKSWYIGKTEMLSNGLLMQNYMYIKNYKDYVLTAPEGYSMEKMKEINDRLGKDFTKLAQPELKPNIVLIMCESFWDPTKLKGVDFSEDIMKNFNKYKKGEIVSPAIGGGTANVEFEALTGLTNYFMTPGVLAYNVYFRRDTPGVVSVLKDNGYDTIAVHPYLAEMYNRNKVYKYLQFDKFISVDEFNLDTDVKGPYVSDESLVDKCLDLLNEDNNPKFIFALTMQNHDPYIDKYPNPEVTASSDNLNEKEEGILGTYAEGIRDGGHALDKLITSLKDSDRPTLVYFFGDHLPRMGTVNDLRDIYNRHNPEIDLYKKDFRTYCAPYASWSNFKETRSFFSPFSPSHIALEILKDSGVDYPNYFNVLAGLEEDNIYLQQLLTKDVDQNNQYIKDYEMIEYDIILGNQYLKKLEENN